MNKCPRRQESKESSDSPASSKKTKTPRAANMLSCDYINFLAAWRVDFNEAIEKITMYVNSKCLDLSVPLDGPFFLTHIQERLGLALEYVILDASEQAQFDGYASSYDLALYQAKDLGIRLLCADPDENPVEKHSGDLSEKVVIIQSCMIALIARGEVQQAWYLGSMLGTLLLISGNLEKKKMLNSGFDKKFGPEKDKIKLLVALAKFIKIKQLPSKKALRVEAFNEWKDEGTFSKKFNRMEIWKYLPDSHRGGKGSKSSKASNEPTIYPIKESEEHETAWRAWIDNLKAQKGSDFKSKVLKEDVPDTAPYCSIKLSEDPDMAQCEIRRIRESFGSVYWLLLIEFGMGQLETFQDLSLFVKKLEGIGLELK